MGIDHGNKRVGIALSDPLGLFAQAHCIITRQSLKKDFARMQAIITKHEVEVIVIGLPTDAEHNVGPQALEVIRWARFLDAAVDEPLYFWDESYSSIEARGIATSNKRKLDDAIDDIAAAVMLQDYLQARGGMNEPGTPLDAYADLG